MATSAQPPARRRSGARRVRCETTGKVRFHDHRDAVVVLHSCATARHFADSDAVDTPRREQRSYRCTHCRGWHLTSQPRPAAGSVKMPTGHADTA